MNIIGLGLREFWQRLRAPPDALMLELGAGGELLVAKLRAGLSLALLLLPLVNIVTGEYMPTEGIAGMFGVILAVAASQVLLLLARHQRRFRWLPWLTTSYDVTLTTFVLALLALSSLAASLNSMVVWAFYLVAVCMTALRNDGRLTLYTGALAMLQYAALAAAVFALAQTPEQLASADYGTARLSNVLQRVLLIAIVTAITAAVVYRMQRLVELSGTDGLTGLPNRTLLVHHFPALLEGAREHGGSLALGLINLDYFRRINDEAGHATGDRALRHAVDVLREGLEAGDLLVRLGGEEFVLLMPLPTGRAWERLEALRRDLATRPFVADADADPLRITFSAGLACWPQDGADLSQMMRRADLRLSRAKLEGRNRVVVR
ncbi:GGDEF domain-containing protein [Thermomonas fusca]|uniref:GGDEF domain-containing protein n=1 Tax=Thermomonas fusca TaxID=215690 RepID=UPI0014860C48|nr:GGDEF domain-containing protein [Thermomonas fusca]MBH2010444.1 GGDEF domain-containing protein [Xanthomonadaceae bacterium]